MGGAPGWLSGFSGSGHDLMVCGAEPCSHALMLPHSRARPLSGSENK